MKSIRSDSITAQVNAMQNANVDIEPPGHVKLREGDLPFWQSIVRARARDTWNNSDLENAANLARTKADIERLIDEIATEGDLILNGRDTKVINPKHALLETLSRRAVALSRMLHVHAEATVGKSEDGAKKLAAEKKAKEVLNKQDELIPRLHAVS